MAEIQGISPYNLNRDIRPQVATRVLIKSEWADSWQTVRYLDAISAETLAAPGIGNAQLMFRYGKNLEAGDTFYRFHTAQELDGKLVQIRTVSGSTQGERILWTGTITSESTQVFGNVFGAPSGKQHITAYEISAILDRHTLENALFEKTEGVAAIIGNMPDFNRRAQFGLSLLGNRSSAKINSAYVFSADGNVWTNRDVIEYLLAAHPPPGLTFRITGQDSALNSITEVHSLEGMSLFRALNSLVDPTRGLGWNLIVSGDATLDFNVFTLLDEDLSVGDTTIPANENIIDNIAVSEDRGVEATITENSDSQFDRINVSGDFIRSVFSVSILEGTLEKAWTTAEEAAYKTPVSAEAEANDAERQTDAHKRVYEAYRIPRDWNGESDTGTPGVHSVALPTLNDDGTIDVTAAAERFLSEKSLSRSLPIEKPTAIAGAEPEYQEPIIALAKDAWVLGSATFSLSVDFVSFANGPGVGVLEADEFLQTLAWTPPGGAQGTPITILPDETLLIPGADANKYVTVTLFAIMPIDETANVTITRRWDQSETAKAGVRMTDGELGFLIEPEINHILGFGSFRTDTWVSDIEPLYDYKGINATVSYDTDQRLRVSAKSEGFEGIAEPKTLTIEVPDASLWYLAPGTMTGITAGAIVRDAVGGILRDDSDRLREIAALALAWYGKRRSIVDVLWRRITNPGVLGSLIRSVSDSWTRTISGTVVTSIEWDFASSEQTTKLTTSFANLQFEKLLTRRDAERMRGDTLKIEKYLSNIPSRFRGGGGGDVTTGPQVIWNEDNQ